MEFPIYVFMFMFGELLFYVFTYKSVSRQVIRRLWILNFKFRLFQIFISSYEWRIPILDLGFRTLDLEFGMLDFEFWIFNLEFRILYFDFWMLDAEFLILYLRFGKRNKKKTKKRTDRWKFF